MNYKYYINNIEVFPYEAGTENIVYEKIIPSSVILLKNVDRNFTFNSIGSFNFKDQEQKDIAEELTFTITEKCKNVTKLIINLVFTIAEGSFNNDRCTYEVKPRNRNSFSTDIPINILLSPGMVTTTTTSNVYPQTFKFANALYYVARKSNPSIKGIISDFFQINPINVSADALPGILNVWTDMRLASLSDIQVPVPSGVARIEMVTFQELFDDISGMFRVYWIIDNNNYLRLEHESFFDKDVVLDLTKEKYSDYLKSNNKYNFDLSDFPKVEELHILDTENYAGIRYAGIANINNNSIQNIFTTKKIRTDFNQIFYNAGNSTVDGLFLFQGASDIVDDYNLHLTPDYLFQNLHTYNRCDTAAFYHSETYQYYFDGVNVAPRYVNRSGGFQSNSTKPIKLQTEVKIPFCCDDIIETQGQVITNLSDNLGNGYIDSAQVDLKSRIANLNLKYKIPKINFTPTDLPNLDLWLPTDRGLIFTPGVGTMTQWTDFSGHGRHAIQSNMSQTLSVDNFLTPSAVDFLGMDTAPKFMKIPGFKLFPNKRGTIFILYKNCGVDVHHLLSTHNTNPFDLFFDLFLVDNVLRVNSGDINVPQLPFFKSALSTLVRNEDDKIYGQWNSMDVAEFHNYGINVFNPMTIDNSDITINDVILGSNPNVGPETNSGAEFVQVQEIIIYGRALSQSEIDKVELYLANKAQYVINNQIN